jgi:hypothetical protein
MAKRQASSNGRVVLDADKLTMGDLRRARERLGRDPTELLNSDVFEEKAAFIVWCMHARTDAAYTWEQAEAVPLGEMQFPEEPPPPPTPEPASSGSPSSGTDETS